MSDSNAPPRDVVYCIRCDEKFRTANEDTAECPHCGKENDMSRYGPMERLRDSILDANGLMGDGNV